VSGVATLFSVEFYRDVRRYLEPGGVFVQWVQLYEITPQLLGSVVGALERNFSDYEFWLTTDSNMLIVAVQSGKVPAPDPRAFDNAALRAELERFGIRNLEDLALHRVGGRAALTPYFAGPGIEPNSDYFPILEMKAPKARYMQSGTSDLAVLQLAPLPVLSLFDERNQRPDPARITPGERPWVPRVGWIRQADEIRRYARSGDARALTPLNPELAADLVLLRAALVDCKVRMPDGALQQQLLDLARYVAVHLPPEETVRFWGDVAKAPCEARLPEADRRWLALHRAIAAGGAAGMANAAQSILESQPELRGPLLAHALSAFMAGKILARQSGAAIGAFRKYRARLGASAQDWQPVFRFLMAQADSR
jgi:hypothetical protein